MKKIRVGVIALLIIGFDCVCSYNLETHALITQEAFDKSILSGQTVASKDLYFRLGFDRLDIQHPFKFDGGTGCKFPFISNYEEDEYLDARGTWLNAPAPDLTNVVSRCPTQYEQRSMPPKYTGLLTTPDAVVGPLGWLRFEGWLMRGAIREDDLKFSNKILASDNLVWYFASSTPNVRSQKAWFLLRDKRLHFDQQIAFVAHLMETFHGTT
jgi:hypothetical protein